jgi:hypothetical protein
MESKVDTDGYVMPESIYTKVEKRVTSLEEERKKILH